MSRRIRASVAALCFVGLSASSRRRASRNRRLEAPVPDSCCKGTPKISDNKIFSAKSESNNPLAVILPPASAKRGAACRVYNLSVLRLQSQRAAFANVACRVCRHGAGLSKERRKVIDGTVQDFGHRPASRRPSGPEFPLRSTLSAHRQGRGLPAPTNAPKLARVYNI